MKRGTIRYFAQLIHSLINTSSYEEIFKKDEKEIFVEKKGRM